MAVLQSLVILIQLLLAEMEKGSTIYFGKKISSTTFVYFFSLYEVYEHTEESNLKYGLRSGGEIVMDRLTFGLISSNF